MQIESNIFKQPLLSALSKTFIFERVNAPNPVMRHIGLQRVGAIVINQYSSPEIGLCDPDEKTDHVDFYSINDLMIVEA